MKELKIFLYPKTKNKYVVLDGNYLMKDPNSGKWIESVLYQEFEKFDEFTGNYIRVPEEKRLNFIREKSNFLDRFEEYFEKRNITFYYGMSGTFKATIIRSILSKVQNISPIWSEIKPWKELENGIFKNKLQVNDLNFAALHLCNLRAHTNSSEYFKKDLLVERGVTDMIFYDLKNNKNKNEDSSWISKVVDKEIKLCDDREIRKILLIQKDTDFINKVIFRESTRKEQFSDINDYFLKQDQYVEFTKKYNKIDEVKVIDSASEFLKELGIPYII